MSDSPAVDWPPHEEESTDQEADALPVEDELDLPQDVEQSSESTVEIEASEEVSQADEAEVADEELESEYGDEEEEEVFDTNWSLPIRAAPILAMSKERVTEFPLTQSNDGRKATTLVVDDELVRIVEARLDNDGHRRLNVRMAMTRENFAGFSHEHHDVFQRLNLLWYACLIAAGLFYLLAQAGKTTISGGTFLGIGLVGAFLAHLEIHRLSFSSNGARHDLTLTAFGQDKILYRGSMALLGPAMAGLIRGEELDTTNIDSLIASMHPPQPMQKATQNSQFNNTPVAQTNISHAETHFPMNSATTVPSLGEEMMPFTTNNGPPASAPTAEPLDIPQPVSGPPSSALVAQVVTPEPVSTPEPVAAPPVVQPPIVEAPIATPPVNEPPIAQPPVATPPIVQPPVEEKPVPTELPDFSKPLVTPEQAQIQPIPLPVASPLPPNPVVPAALPPAITPPVAAPAPPPGMALPPAPAPPGASPTPMQLGIVPPLSTPMPPAPQVAVPASKPVNMLSQEETNDLLNELL